MPEQKINHHCRTFLADRIICNFGQSTINCVVRRVSDHGATIEVESPLGIAEHFHLLISGEGVPRPCKLVWQSGKELGLEFEHADAIKPDAGVEPDHPGHRQMVSGQMLALKLALDEIPIGVLLLGGDMRAQFMNRAFRMMWNVSDSMAEKKPAFVVLLYHSRDTNAFQKEKPDLDAFAAERIRQVRAGDTTPFDLRRSNGEVIRAQCTVLPNGGRLLTYTSVTDIVRHSDELEVLRNALDNIQDGVLLLDADFNTQFLNRKMREYWGVTEEQAAAHPAYAKLIARAPNAAAGEAPVELMCGFPASRASPAPTADASVQDVQIPDGRYIRVHRAEMANGGRMFTYCDVTDLIRNAEQLEKLATIDSMTGLYNRRHFLVLAEVEWSRFQRYHRPLSMLMIDIDHFKSVNDRYGHAVGDQGIRWVAAACHEGKRGADSVGRLGGEEFAILLPETDQAQAWIVAERIREKVAGHVLTAQEVEFSLTISVGIAAAVESMSGVDALLRAADQALYQAKFEGRNRTAQWSPELAPGLAAE
jgi:diguanylate cyclase (GGDEF)-like protein